MELDIHGGSEFLLVKFTRGVVHSKRGVAREVTGESGQPKSSPPPNFQDPCPAEVLLRQLSESRASFAITLAVSFVV